MFIRTKTTPNSPRKSVQIVENQRDPKTDKVKQKILRHVGIAMNDTEEDKLKALALEIIAKMQVEQELNSPQMNMLAAPSEENIANTEELYLWRKLLLRENCQIF